MNNSYQKVGEKHYIVIDDEGLKNVTCDEDINFILSLQNEIEEKQKKLAELNYKLFLYNDKDIRIMDGVTYLLPACLFGMTTLVANINLAFPITIASSTALLQNKYNYYNTLEDLKAKKEDILKEKEQLERLIKVMQDNLAVLCEDSQYKEDRVELKRVLNNN